MDELPDLLAMILADSQIAGNITLDRVKLVYGINYGLKKYFLEQWGGLAYAHNFC